MNSNDNTKTPTEPPAGSSPQKPVNHRVRAIQANGFKLSIGAEPTKPTPILDSTLEKHDLRISIRVDVHGRELNLAKLNSERVVLGGIESPKDRWRVLEALETVLKEIQRDVGANINIKLGGEVVEPAADAPP
jgi:hypothetical protein